MELTGVRFRKPRGERAKKPAWVAVIVQSTACWRERKRDHPDHLATSAFIWALFGATSAVGAVDAGVKAGSCITGDVEIVTSSGSNAAGEAIDGAARTASSAAAHASMSARWKATMPVDTSVRGSRIKMPMCI